MSHPSNEGQSAVGHRLADVPLFAELPPDVLDELARASRVRRYPAHQVLFMEGDPGDALIVLEEGQLRISRFSSAGDEAVLAVVEPPAAVGELSLLDGAPRDATVIAQRSVRVRLVPRTTFQEVMRKEPAAVAGLHKTLAGWIRLGNQRHADLVTLDVPGRLARWLLVRAGDESGVAVTSTDLEIGRSQGELAAELGTTRSTLNRALQGFADLGLISVASGGEQIVLLDPVGLAAYTA